MAFILKAEQQVEPLGMIRGRFRLEVLMAEHNLVQVKYRFEDNEKLLKCDDKEVYIGVGESITVDKLLFPVTLTI